MSLPKLFKTAKNGKVQVWEIWTEGNLIQICHGFANSSNLQYETIEIKEGTNIGKVNERTLDEQADFEAEARWKAQIDYKGYVTDLKDEQKRAAYDRMGHDAFQAGGSAGSRPATRRPPRRRCRAPPPAAPPGPGQ